MNFKIATYNISHCQDMSDNHNNDAPVNIPKMAEFIKSFDADIVSLNEVYMRSSNENFDRQAEKIMEITEHPYFAQAVGEDLGWTVIGNALLSRLPILESFEVPVLVPTEDEKRPNENDWYEDRVILGAKLQAGEREILLLATHFGLNGLEQERIVKAVCEIIDNAKKPIILMGDFNALPHCEALAPIYERLVSAAEEMNNNDFTFASFKPDRTIDYIFVSKDIKVECFEVKKDILSDHRPCVAKVTL